jgi:hypothetical protein
MQAGIPIVGLVMFARVWERCGARRTLRGTATKAPRRRALRGVLATHSRRWFRKAPYTVLSTKGVVAHQYIGSYAVSLPAGKCWLRLSLATLGSSHPLVQIRKAEPRLNCGSRLEAWLEVISSGYTYSPPSCSR